MITPEYCRFFARYNRWMNERIVAGCRALQPRQLCEDRGAFFGSILGTLNHLLVADRLWLARFTDAPAPTTPLDAQVHADLPDLARARCRLDDAIDAWAAGVTTDWLNTTHSYTSLVGGDRRELRGWVMAAHFFNHQTHHRGQVTTLMTQSGIDPGVTDLAALPVDAG